MATLEDKLLGEKLNNYCSSSEDEGEEGGEGGEDDGKDTDPDKRTSSKKGGSSLKFIPEAELKNDATHWTGNSSNTGPKGVIKDWQRFKQLETEKRNEQERERLELMKKLSIKTRTKAEDEEAKKQEELDAELDELMNDDFLLEYQKKRMIEMLKLTGRMQTFGNVIGLCNGEDFLNAIDKENKNVTIIIHIYEDKVSACKRMNVELTKLAKEYSMVKFCKIVGSIAGISKLFKSSGIPALLVYKAGQVIGNFVRVTDDLGDDFCHSDIESFLIEHGMLPDKSTIPIITSSSNDNEDDDDK
uniref:Putative phosducin-like protein n=1 Tax=Corethrella appendiculata TaxID=1370023 RepID=U5EYG4_9DIPT